MSQRTESEPDDRLQIAEQLRQQRLLREAERGEPKPKKKVEPGVHWYRDRQSRGGIKKG